jgi:endonuclease/exonuclease/phosphatase family metal-dependent hydrolase
MDGMSITIVSSNVRGPADPGPAAWEARRDLLASVLVGTGADVIGTQETTGAQRDDLLARMPDYAFLGRDHHGHDDGEHTGLLYRTDRVELVEHGDFWLSDTPDAPGTGTWGNPTPRVVTWGRFRAGGAEFVLADSHFPWPSDAEGEDGRTRCAAVLRERAFAIAGGGPLILTGDFNTGPASAAHAELTDGLEDAVAAALAAGVHAGPEATFHDFTGTPDERIDWILQRGFTPVSTATLDAHEGDVWPSDHFPVVAVLDPVG